MQPRLQTLGIIGGAFSAVTSNLYARLAVHLKSNVIISSYPDAPRHSVSPEDTYQCIKSLALKLKYGMGIEHIVYPCNTGHVHRDRLMNETDMFMFDMIKPTREIVASTSKSKQIGLLSSTSTQKTKLYESKLEYELVTPSEHLQKQIQASIIKVGAMPNLDTKYDRKLNEIYKSAIYEMKTKGADTIIVGCTDISYYFDCTRFQFEEEEFGMSIVDSQNVLISEILHWNSRQCNLMNPILENGFQQQIDRKVTVV